MLQDKDNLNVLVTQSPEKLIKIIQHHHKLQESQKDIERLLYNIRAQRDSQLMLTLGQLYQDQNMQN